MPQAPAVSRADTVTTSRSVSFEEPYRVVEIERRTATLLELGLRPLAPALEYLPGEYVLLETATTRRRHVRTRSPTRPPPTG
jgi:NAD(P)H-flavin reductase